MRSLLIYFSCLTLLKEKLYLGTAGNGMLVFDIGKTAFSICPEVENGYIKSIILQTYSGS